jgi:hypothetical protein
VRTGARNRITHPLHRFPTSQQARTFAGSDELRAAMTGAGVDRSADRIELAVEA